VNLDALLAAIGTPKLTDAACRGRHELFDNSDHTQALALCQQCPALHDCTQWLAGLPRSRRPHGVVAGQPPSARVCKRAAQLDAAGSD
jgi:Transcription factor WhiB